MIRAALFVIVIAAICRPAAAESHSTPLEPHVVAGVGAGAGFVVGLVGGIASFRGDHTDLANVTLAASLPILGSAVGAFLGTLVVTDIRTAALASFASAGGVAGGAILVGLATALIGGIYGAVLGVLGGAATASPGDFGVGVANVSMMFALIYGSFGVLGGALGGAMWSTGRVVEIFHE